MQHSSYYGHRDGGEGLGLFGVFWCLEDMGILLLQWVR